MVKRKDSTPMTRPGAPNWTRLPSATLRRIAVVASVDPRSVQKEWLNAGSVRGLSGDRIRELFGREGLR